MNDALMTTGDWSPWWDGFDPGQSDGPQLGDEAYAVLMRVANRR